MVNWIIALMFFVVGVGAKVLEIGIESNMEGDLRAENVGNEDLESTLNQPTQFESLKAGEYRLPLEGSRLHTTERGVDKSADGRPDQWILSARKGKPIADSAENLLLVNAIFQDNDFDEVPDLIAISVVSSGSTTELVSDLSGDRRDVIVTLESGDKYGYTDLNSDGTFDLLTEYKNLGAYVERFVVHEHNIFRVTKTYDKFKSHFLIERRPGVEQDMQWDGERWLSAE